MREIKFRARSVSLNRWFYYTLDDLLYKQFGRGPGRAMGVDPGMEHWSQYTGLKDSRRREIYEGDILRYSEDGFGEFSYEGVIEYAGESDYPAFDLRPRVDCDSNGLSYIMACCFCEVIGTLWDDEKPHDPFDGEMKGRLAHNPLGEKDA